MAIPGILHYRYDIVPALTEVGIDVGDIAGSIVAGTGIIDYVVAGYSHGGIRFSHRVHAVDTDLLLRRWGIDTHATEELFPKGVAQAAVIMGNRVAGWILVDVSGVDVPITW